MGRRSFIPMLSLLLCLAGNSEGAELKFNDLSETEAKKVIKELSGNFTYTSVSGAAPLGSVFGFEVGVVAGLTSTDQIDKLVKEIDSSVDADPIPHAGILGMISVPLGFTAEAVFLPTLGSDEFKFNTLGLGVKWTLTETLLDLPVDLALRGHFTKTNVEFKQTVSSVTANVDLEDTVTGVTALVSKSFVIVAPYAGIGFVQSEGKFDVSGSTTFFTTGVTSFKAKDSGTQFLLGTEVSLLFLKLGLEYSRQFDVNRFSGKLAFSF